MLAAFPATVARMEKVSLLKRLKTVVLIREKRDSHAPWRDDKRERDWWKGQQLLAQTGKGVNLVYAPNSRHLVPYDESQLIAYIIKGIIDTADQLDHDRPQSNDELL